MKTNLSNLVTLAGSSRHCLSQDLVQSKSAAGTTHSRLCIETGEPNQSSPLWNTAEFMFQDIKGGLWAELLRSRAFEETAPRPSVAHYGNVIPTIGTMITRLSSVGRALGWRKMAIRITFAIAPRS